MVGQSQEVVPTGEEAHEAGLSHLRGAVAIDVEQQYVDLAGSLRGNPERVTVRTPRGPEDIRDPVVDVVTGAGAEELVRDRVRHLLSDAVLRDHVGRAPRGNGVCAAAAGAAPVRVGHPHRHGSDPVRDHAARRRRDLDQVVVFVKVEKRDRVALRYRLPRLLLLSPPPVVRQPGVQRRVVVELRDPRAVVGRRGHRRPRLLLMLRVGCPQSLGRGLQKIEPLDAGLHAVMGGVGRDQVHLGRDVAQVQRVERVVENFPVRVEHEHLVAAAVGGDNVRDHRWARLAARYLELGDDPAAAAPAFVAGTGKGAGEGADVPAVVDVDDVVGLGSIAVLPVVDAHLVDARWRRPLRPADVLVADEAPAPAVRIEVELTAAFDLFSTVVDFVAVRVYHVQIEIGIGIPGHGHLQVAAGHAPYEHLMARRRPHRSGIVHRRDRQAKRREFRIKIERHLPDQPMRQSGTVLQVDLVVPGTLFEASRGIRQEHRHQQLGRRTLGCDFEEEGAAIGHYLVPRHVGNAGSAARFRQRLECQRAVH